MLECLKFILKCVNDLISMLFRIDVGFTNLGVVMCICYILLPMLLFIVNFLKSSFLSELDETYDERRPRETWTKTIHKRVKTGDNQWTIINHSKSKSRRLRS